MERISISTTLADRIEHLMNESSTAHNVTVGPRHDPTVGVEAIIRVDSALGRFLVSKNYVNAQLIADFDRWCTLITVKRDFNTCGAYLRLRAVAVG